MQADELECIIHNLPGAVYRCLPDENWTACFVSEGMTSLTGYPAADFLYNEKRALQDIIHAEDLERVRDSIRARIREQASFSEEVRICHADGSVRWLYVKGQPVRDLDGSVLFIDAALIDITAQKMAEAALQEERDNMRSLMANLPGIVYRTALGEEWTIEFVSGGVQDLLGVPPSEFIGKGLESYGAYVHPDDLQRVAETIVQAGSRSQSYEVRYRVRGPDGQWREVFEKGRSREVAADGRRYLDGMLVDVSRVAVAPATDDGEDSPGAHG